MTSQSVYLFLATGVEELEAVTVVDILRRAGLCVTTISMVDNILVTGAHDITLTADNLFDLADFSAASMLVLPGGLPGAANLRDSAELCALLREKAAEGVPLAAISAAPMVLGNLDLLQGKRASCYPGFEQLLLGAEYTAAPVEVDGNIITGKGPGAAVPFALAIVERLCGPQQVALVRNAMLL